MTLTTSFCCIEEGEKMANLADIIVSLTLDTSEFSRSLRDAGQELNNFRNHVNQVTQNMENDFTNSMSNMGDSMQSMAQATQNASQSVSQSTSQASNSVNRLSTSSRKLARNMGTDMESMYRVLQAASSEFERFGSNANRVSMETAKNFAYLPRHLQLYVQRLQEAGQSTAAFGALNEQYGKRWVEMMVRQNNLMQEGTTQASRLNDAMERRGGNALQQSLLGIADGLERSARQGSALNLALQRLGENATPKQLAEEMRVISEGVARANQLMIFMGITTGAMLYGMVQLSNAVDGRLIPAFDQLKSTWADALTPFINAFTTFVLWIMKGAQALGELAKKLAEVHPQLSQMLWGFLALTVALTAILAPLAVTGVLAEGLAATFAALWAMIGGFVTALLTVLPVAAAIAAAIVIVVASINNMWKASEKLRNAWNGLWSGIGKVFMSGFVEPIKQACSGLVQAFSNLIANITGGAGTMASLWTFLGNHVGTVINAIASVAIPILSVAFQVLGQVVAAVINGITFLINGLAGAGETVTTFGTALKTMFTAEDFAGIQQLFANLVPMIVGFLIGGIPQLLIMGSTLISKIAEGMGISVPQLITNVLNIITQIINTFLTMLPVILQTGASIILGLLQGLMETLPVVLEGLSTAITTILTTFVNLFTAYFPTILQIGLDILTTLINGIVQMLPQLVNTALNIITTFLNIMMQNLPKIIDAGYKVLMALIDGIIKVLPQLINAVIKIVETFCNFVIQNLPKIIDSGMKVLTALVNGILKMMPQLTQAAISLIAKLVETLVANLPKIIDSGVKILTSLVNGIIKMLPQLITTAITLIGKVVTTLIQHLPEIIEAGIKILLALIKGLIQAIPQLVAAIPKIVTAIFDAFKKVKWGDIGKDIMSGIGKGITAAKDALFGTVADIASGLLAKGKQVLGIHSPSREFANEVGKFIPQGIAVGIKNESDVAYKSVEDVTAGIVPSKAMMDSAMRGVPSMSPVDSGTMGNTSNNNIVINATVRELADIQRIVDELEKRRKISERSQGVFSY